LHYQAAWPNREFETARDIRKTPLHDRLAFQGACFGIKNGWERPNWFAHVAHPEGASTVPKFRIGNINRADSPSTVLRTPSPPLAEKERTRGHGSWEGQGEGILSSDKAGNSVTGILATKPATEYSFGRQNWFANHAAEHRATRENVAIFDQTGFSKYLVRGRDAVKVLQRLCGNNVDVPVGRTVYTGLFNERGGIESDLTGVRLGPDEFYLISGTSQTWRDLDWIRRNIRNGEHAEAVDVTNGYGVLGVMGPDSRRLLSRVTDADLSNGAFPFGAAREISVGRSTARAIRITYVGELGWELHVPMEQLVQVYETLAGVAGDPGVVNAGHYAPPG
jgi:heterotetrameric sarcosine oxidase gamma subunit